MTTAWMVYCLLVSLFLGGGALAAEHGFRLYRWPVRWLWLATMLGSLGLPLAAYFLPVVPALAPQPLARILDAALEGDALITIPAALAAAPPSLLQQIDQAVLVVWALTSLSFLTFYVHSYFRLRRASKSWVSRTVAGRQAWISQAVGPAVLGFFRGLIVVPGWVIKLEEELTRIILLHEEEHLRAGDHRTFVIGLGLLMTMPWNLLLWWQLRRLRLAVELDCDRRVVARGTRLSTYTDVLLQASLRGPGTGFLPSRLVKAGSLLERRIRSLTTGPVQHRLPKAAAAGVMVALMLFGACQTPSPSHLGEVRPLAPAGADLAAVTVRVTSSQAGSEVRFQGTSLFKFADWPPRVIEEETPFEFELAAHPMTLIIRKISGDALVNVELIGLGEHVLSATGDYVIVEITQGGEARVSAYTRPPAAGEDPGTPEPPLIAPRDLRPQPDEPYFTPFTEKPRLIDRRKAEKIIEQNYPKLLKDAGVGGTVSLWVFIDIDGKVIRTKVFKSSGHEALDQAAQAAAQEFEFIPAKNRDQVVPVWVSIPISFSAK